MSGTVTGGTQSTNNIVGDSSSGVNVEGYTDQTATAKQYLTAAGMTASVSGRRAAFTVTGQRGAAVVFSTSTFRVLDGMNWDYLNSGTSVVCFNLWHRYSSTGTFPTKLVLKSPLANQTVTLTVSVAVTSCLGQHDQSLFLTEEPSEHDGSFAGRVH